MGWAVIIGVKINPFLNSEYNKFSSVAFTVEFSLLFVKCAIGLFRHSLRTLAECVRNGFAQQKETWRGKIGKRSELA